MHTLRRNGITDAIQVTRSADEVVEQNKSLIDFITAIFLRHILLF